MGISGSEIQSMEKKVGINANECLRSAGQYDYNSLKIRGITETLGATDPLARMGCAKFMQATLKK